VRNLHSLESFNVGYRLALTVYRLTLRDPLARHFGLADQIRRAAISIPANVAEGYALGTRPQLIRHLRIALGSSAELGVHLDLAADLGLAERDDANKSRQDCTRLVALLIGLLKRLGAQVPRGR